MFLDAVLSKRHSKTKLTSRPNLKYKDFTSQNTTICRHESFVPKRPTCFDLYLCHSQGHNNTKKHILGKTVH